jgi:hypothetical protein
MSIIFVYAQKGLGAALCWKKYDRASLAPSAENDIKIFRANTLLTFSR